MKSKIKSVKILKLAFVFILLICLVASSVPISFAAEITAQSEDIESGEIIGAETASNLNTIDTPISKMEINDIDIIQNTHRTTEYDYNPSTDDWDLEYYIYDYTPKYKITFKDGTVVEGNYYYFDYNDDYYRIDYTDDQSYDNQWELGSHKVTAKVLGYETSFNVNIIESPYKSFEILEVKPLEGLANSEKYDFPWFKYKVTEKDGSSFIDMYMGGNNYIDENLSIEKDYDREIRGSWKIGQDNSFKAYYADLEATVNVEIIPGSGYEYIEQNGGLYITNVMDLSENIEIPSEINGIKVIGITSFGDATESVKNLTIPDTVKNIGEEALRWCNNLKTLTIGSGVNYLDADMFNRCASLESITVSSANEKYASVDGIVYNKAKDTLVVYPLGKGESYNVPASVSNIDALDSWQYANVNVTFSDASKSYKTVDGVTYTADMTKVIRCNKDKSGEYTMPDTVTKISDKAFSGCENLTEVKVSDNVTEIVYGAFENCSSLKSVTIPDKVNKMGEYAFMGCEELEKVYTENIESWCKINFETGTSNPLSCAGNLYINNEPVTKVDIPNSIKDIKDYTFDGFTSLENITIHDSVKSIGNGAFAGCTSLTSVMIPDSVTSIGGGAFSGCSLTSITIPDSVKSIGSGAFSGCKNLTNAKIGNGVMCISNWTFADCGNLKSVTLGSSVTTIDTYAFENCGLTEVVLPKNVSYIGDNAFRYCGKLNNLVIENEAIKIGDYAFNGCPLKNYKPDTNIAEMGLFSFIDTDIESVNISKTVTEITYGSFYNCENLEDINVPSNVLKISGKAFDNTKWYKNQNDGEVYLDHIFYRYKGEMPENTEIKIKNGTTTIADYALMNGTNLTSLTLPDGLKRIGGLAFYNCDSITEINIPASVEDIGPYAFANCKSLTKINVSPDNKYYASVDGVLFNKAKTELIYCPKQQTSTYSVPSSVKKIKAFAFDSECVPNITITNSNIELEEYAFGANLMSIHLPESDSKDASVRYSDITVCCPKNSTTEEYADEHLIDIIDYVEPTQSVNTGDANGDGEVNAKDRMMLTRYLAKWSGYENVDMTVADVNNDGEVNAKDRMILTRHLAKWSGYETLPYTK